MFKIYAITFIILAFIFSSAEAHKHPACKIDSAKIYMEEIEKQDKAYITKHGSAFFHRLVKGQMPRATIVTCSDSRVQTNIIDKTPEGDLFVISNIGNQITTAKGSVEYGINHLGTSLLLIIGHSQCGAIFAASSDYTRLEPAIIRELNNIHIDKGLTNIQGVKTNVNNQVALALKEFGNKVSSNELFIVGAIYDFANDMQQGAGKLNIININGETNPAKIRSIMTQL
jgi:carbonic anhydrase